MIKVIIKMDVIWSKMYDAATSVMFERSISEYVTAGEVGAAILSDSGRVVTLGKLTPEWWI